MAENQKVEEAVVLRIPTPNLQIIVLGLIAIITVFQTIQLVRISSQTSSAKTVTAPATTTNSSGTGAGSNSNAPQSMVGGC